MKQFVQRSADFSCEKADLLGEIYGDTLCFSLESGVESVWHLLANHEEKICSVSDATRSGQEIPE